MERRRLLEHFTDIVVLALLVTVLPLAANAMVISGDNVGIGTAIPTQPLEVIGNIKFSGGALMFPDGSSQSTATLVGPQGPPGNVNYTKTVFVGPIGTATQNGTALLNGLAGITTASATNPYLLKIEPGIYDIGSANLQMKQYVDMEGSGENTTIITGSGQNGVVNGASNTEIRFLTVRNTGGGTYAIAITNNDVSTKITNVTAIASGGVHNLGINNIFSSSPILTNVTAKAEYLGGTYNSGIVNNSNSTTVMTNVTASASGGSSENDGVLNIASTPTMTNVTATASGGATSQGVHNDTSNSIMTNVIATGSGATTNNIGVGNTSSSPNMTNITATASGGTFSHGVSNIANSSPTMTFVFASATDGVNNNGIQNDSSKPHMHHVRAETSGGTNSNGVLNQNSSAPLMEHIKIIVKNVSNGTGVRNLSSSAVISFVSMGVNAANAGGNNFGIYNDSSSTRISSVLIAAGGNCQGTCYGVYSVNSGTVTIDNSVISGATNTIFNGIGVTTFVGSTQLDGGPVNNSGVLLKCIGAYNNNYDALDSTCQ